MHLLKNLLKYSFLIIGFTIVGSSCDSGSDDDNLSVMYPSDFEEVKRKLIQNIDFSASINPDTLKYQYDEFYLSETKSTRDLYRIDYNYDAGGMLLNSEKHNLSDETLISETNYTYDVDQVEVVKKASGVLVEQTVWTLSGTKGIVSNSILNIVGTIVEQQTLYSWNGENLEMIEVYQRINEGGSIDLTDLELHPDDETYFLKQRFTYESYHEAINIERYLSTQVPISSSQQLFEIVQVKEFDEGRGFYFYSTSYSTMSADSDGYPSRVAVGGYAAKKQDFKY